MAPNGYQTAVHPNQPSSQAAAASTPGTSTYNPRSPHYDSTLDRSSPNYIPPASTSDTGAEVHGRAEDRVSAEDAATNDEIWGIRELINRFTHDGRVNEQYLQEMDAQAQQLAAAGGQTRQGPMMACSNYMAWPHSDLKRMVNEDADPGGVGTAGDQWINAGNAMVEFQDQVRTAINNSEADWQGASGNRARGFMADVGNWVGSTGTQAQLAGTQTNRASTSLSTARDAMPEEVPYDAAKAMQDYNDAFWPWDKKAISDQAWADYRASEEAHQRAAQVVGTYDANLSGASTMPAFGPPPTMAGDPGGNPPKPPPDGGGPYPPGGGGPYPPGGGPGGGPGGFNPPPGGGGSGGSGLPGTGGSGPGGSGSGGLPGGPGYPGGTNPGGAGPGRPGGSGGPGGPGGPGSGGPGDGGFPGMPIGGGPLPGGFGNDFERGGGGGRGPGVGARGFGPGGTGGGFGPGGSGPGSGGSGPGMGRGPGGMGAGGAGALAAEHAAGGGRGPGGRGGAGGPMGGMGGGRGQGEEDGEHQRPSYLVEADPESLFGTDEMTAPPVIGE